MSLNWLRSSYGKTAAPLPVGPDQMVSRPAPTPPPEPEPPPLARAIPPATAAAVAALRAYADTLPTDQAGALRWMRSHSSSGALSMLRAVAIQVLARAEHIEHAARLGLRHNDD